MPYKILPEHYRLAFFINVQENKIQHFAVKTLPVLFLPGLTTVWALLRLIFPGKAGALSGMGINGVFLFLFLAALSFGLDILFRRIARLKMTGTARSSTDACYIDRRHFYLITLTPAFSVELFLLLFLLIGAGTFFSIVYFVFMLHTVFCWKYYYTAVKLFAFPCTTLVCQQEGITKFYVESDEVLRPDREETRRGMKLDERSVGDHTTP